MSAMPTRLSEWHLAANEWQQGRAHWTAKEMAAGLSTSVELVYYIASVLMSFGLTEVYGTQGRFHKKLYRATGKEITEDMRVPDAAKKRKRTGEGWIELWNAMGCGKKIRTRGKPSRVHYLLDEEETA